MAQSVDSLQMFVGVGFIHPAIVLLPISTPANKKLDTAMGVGSFVEDLRNIVESNLLMLSV